LLAVLPDEARPSDKQKSPLLKIFGPEVAALVQGTRSLLRLGQIAGKSRDESTDRQDQNEMQRKMLLAMAADLRIVLLRLASRTQSLRWFAESRTPCPPEFAREAMELYAPLANRLGIWQLKWEMEDLAFRFLQPDTYKDIARQLEERRAERESFIAEVVHELQTMLADAKVSGSVSGRPKHIYSIWSKMRNKNLSFDKLYDLRALRVIVEDERACYAVLALVHARWTPISEEFDDYISRPKPNGYRSLHTVVADAKGRSFEIQIRTHEMHVFAEYGMAAHWRYKEAGAQGGTQRATGEYDRKVSWMRQLLAWGGDEAPGEAAASAVQAQEPAAPERIYVMTPQARVIELPQGATPIDFAYYLHTDLGHRCRGARVDGQMVPLLTQLKTGQTVEIIAAKSGGPSRDWLNPQLGYLASPRSRAKVRAWFNAIELQERISSGQGMVEKELQRLGKTAVNLEQLAQQLGFAQADDLYVAVAKDEFSLRQIDQALRTPADQTQSDTDATVFTQGQANVVRTGKSGVLVMGVDSLLTQLARCCRPAPPDPIAGFVTRGRGVSIHRRDCPSFAALAASQAERVIEVDWGDTGETVYPVDVSIHAQQSANLLRDLSDVFGRLRLNVVGVNTQSRRSLAHMVFTVEVRNGEQISRALTALNELPGVTAVRQ
ncbi:MAG TPA: bifunctional (p)ppGpp synthetase/guanosine-3',5'-bis(diphosphate) 3'-pyrophosphohydrolase, partial [Pusillimonas sp.]|uniref:RelA/SpoT family protein n=1 Tax=Pusillimonas sp. TaxID=3040095 RepID=UPI002C2C6FC8